MSKTTLAAVAIMATVSSVALAQADSKQAASGSSTHVKSAGDATADQSNLQQQITTNLQQSGFTNVKIMPGSFLVNAEDKSGNPVTMLIGPHSFTEVTAINANPQTVGANSSNVSAPAANAGSSGGAFTAVPAKDELSSKVIGLDVYNNAKQSIGTIKDIAFNDRGIDGYVLSVGGFLGIGDHYVAVRPSSVNVTFDRANNRWHATMDANADQLKAAPEFKYPSNS